MANLTPCWAASWARSRALAAQVESSRGGGSCVGGAGGEPTVDGVEAESCGGGAGDETAVLCDLPHLTASAPSSAVMAWPSRLQLRKEISPSRTTDSNDHTRESVNS